MDSALQLLLIAVICVDLYSKEKKTRVNQSIPELNKIININISTLLEFLSVQHYYAVNVV